MRLHGTVIFHIGALFDVSKAKRVMRKAIFVPGPLYVPMLDNQFTSHAVFKTPPERDAIRLPSASRRGSARNRGDIVMERRKKIGGTFAAAAVLLLGTATLANAGTFNQAGNILIADQFNNRVIEIDHSGNIVWSFGLGPKNFSEGSIVGVNDAERVGSNTLMAGTGIPAGADPFCTNANGCLDNRVLLVNSSGKIIWQYGKFRVTGAGKNQLSAPVQATWTPSRTVFITDQGNQRIIEVDLAKQIIWQYGQTGVSGSGTDQLNNPNSAELLPNHHVLIADEGNNRVIEVTQDKAIVATYTAGGTISGAAFASRLPNGDTLISDSNNNRIVEVNRSDDIVWQYATNTQTGSNASPLPTRAVQTINGEIVISDQFNNRVIVIRKGSKALAVQYGTLNVAGYGTTNANQGQNAPYDAKVIGDYTGLTPPY
jgi:hypothetical protein